MLVQSSSHRNVVKVFFVYELDAWSYNEGAKLHLGIVCLQMWNLLKMLVFINLDILATVLDLIQAQLFYGQEVNLVKILFLFLEKTILNQYVFIIEKMIS